MCGSLFEITPVPSWATVELTILNDAKVCGLTFARLSMRGRASHVLPFFFLCCTDCNTTTQTCLHPQRLHLVVICLHNTQAMFVVAVKSLFHGGQYFSRCYLSLVLLLGVGLVHPAVEVRSQKHRLLLLQCQPVPPAFLLLLDFNVHLTLRGLMVDLKTVIENYLRQSIN